MTLNNPVDPEVWTKARLVEPLPSGFVHLSISAGGWPIPPALPSGRRRRARKRLHELAAAIGNDVIDATVFTALVRAPGGREAAAEVAYDLVLLVETSSVERARELVSSTTWRSRVDPLIQTSSAHLEFVASNIQRMASVDHSRRGVFLFNYFSAPTVEANLFAWQYTAGWFQDQTGLDNSTVLEPEDDGPFSLVNHCRWDHLADVMPKLVFARSFREFVLRVFDENRVKPRPLLFRISRG